MRYSSMTILIFAILLAAIPCYPIDRIVHPNGTGDYPTIQAAISSAIIGDRIVLANGVFTGDGNTDIDFLGKSISLTSMSGDPLSSVIDCQGSTAGLRFNSDEGPSTTVEAITIRNAYAGPGAAISCEDASPTLVGCLFEACSTGTSGFGGAIEGHNSSLTLIECTFIGNSSRIGGGLHLWGIGNPTIEGCTFKGNTSTYRGGAIATAPGISLTITESLFISNESPDGGAIWIGQNYIEISNCTFYGNHANIGGAIKCLDPGTLVLSNSLISHNTAGGCIAYTGSALLILECCDLIDSGGLDWTGILAQQYGLNGNIREDPQYCSTSPIEDSFWGLQSDSPCSPAVSLCGQIGAFRSECESTHNSTMQWGQVKTLFK